MTRVWRALVTTVSVTFVPRLRNTTMSSKAAITPRSTPSQRTQIGNLLQVYDQVIQAGLITYANNPAIPTSALGRRVLRINIPSARRSSFSLDARWTLMRWYMPIGKTTPNPRIRMILKMLSASMAEIPTAVDHQGV